MSRAIHSILALGVSAFVLSACEGGGPVNFGGLFQGSGAETSAAEPAPGGSVETIERDVEDPSVFEANEPGLWDGRPSLGGVWVAHPDVKDPERVIIRNTANDKFVVGALFRREREIPGPRLQISSDAAEALGILAGAPAPLSVIALRKEIVAVEPEATESNEIAPPADIETAALDPIAGAAAVLGEEAASAPSETATVASDPAPQPRASRLEKPFIQIGIFSVEANATRTATQMRSAGLVPTIKPGSRDGKPFWRVVVGPASSSSERSILLGQIKEQGFTDAYAVTN